MQDHLIFKLNGKYKRCGKSNILFRERYSLIFIQMIGLSSNLARDTYHRAACEIEREERMR